MPNVSPTIVAASLSDEKLKESIDKMVANLNDGLEKMKTSTDAAVEYMQKSLQKLENTKVDMSGSADGGASRRAKANNEETASLQKSTAAVKEKTANLDQQAQAMQSAANTGKKYTDEIIRQANAIRATEEWQKQGWARVDGNVYYDPARSTASKKESMLRGSLEEQILRTVEKRQLSEELIANAKKIEEDYARRAREEEERRNREEEKRLSINKEITAEQERQKKAYVSPTLSETDLNKDFFKNFMARRLGVNKQQIINWDEEKNSINTLQNALKQLQTTYSKLNSWERSSEIGKTIASDIQVLERAIQRIKQQASRPVDLESVLGIKPKTLDDMSYKLRQLQAYKQGIDLTKPNADAEIKKVDAAIKQLKTDMDKYMATSRQVNSMNNALARSFNYMKNRLAFYFTVGASTAFVKNLIDIRAQYEMNERALGILINSAERGTQIFQELSQMALVSPYTLIELSTAAKQLTAYDVAARDVVDTTRRLADMAAAVGIPIERLTYALGQIKAYGYLNARDARMFSNAGIPLVKQLAEYYTELEGKLVSTADVYDRIKKKAIGYNDVMQVVNKMTDEGGKFFDFQAKMATTLKVQLANLTLAWNNMLNDIGQSEQGMLSGMIGLLKNAFLQWKNINRIIEDLAITFGVVKVAQFAYYGVVLGTNKAIAAQAVLGTKLTSILKTIGGTMNQVLTSGATWWGVLAAAATGAVISIIRGNEAMKEFNKSLREDASSTYDELSKFLNQYQNIRDSLYKTETKKRFVSSQYSEGWGTEESYSAVVGTNDIDKKEALKAWEAVREQIELSSKASSEFVGKLLAIENVSERLRQGFKILDDIQTVTAALKELGDEGIKLERSWSEWWNLGILPDGTIENLKDSYIWLDKINDKFGSLENARVISTLDKTKEGFKNLYKDVAEDYIENYEKELEKFRKDLSTTTQSVIDFINLKGWQGDETKIEETFRRAFQNIALKNNLSPQQAMTMQLEAAQAEYNAIQNALQIHINDEQAALSKARDENERADIESRLKVYKDDLSFMQSNTAQSRVYWEDFTKWMGEQHKSEVQAMFKGQSAEQIKMLDFSRGEYNKWVVELAQKYAKEHGMAYKEVYDQLRNYILNANQWSIRIPLIISTQAEKSVYETLTAADTAIDAAYKKIQRLQTRLAELNKKGGLTSPDEKVAKESAKIVGEIADAQKDYNKALEEGGHSKKEDAAAKKAQKQAESELQKALKEELQLIDKVRSAYKQLTKDEMNRTDAIALATSGLEESVQNVNKVLGKYGLQLDLSKFAGVTNPNEMVDMLNKQINVLMKTGAAKPAEIQDLQLKIKDFKLEAGSFNQKLLVDSLNNELGRLKEEYELAISLDADPELGYAFADMMGVNMDNLPRTVQEYADEYTKYLNKYFAENKTDIELPNLNLTNDDLKWFEQMVKDGKLSEGTYKKIAEAVKDVREKKKKDFDETRKEYEALIKKYGEYEAKLQEVANTADKERLAFAKQFGDEGQKGKAIRLIADIQAETDPKAKEELRKKLQELAREIAGDDSTRIKLQVAIDNKALQEQARVNFEQFQKSPEWITATGDLAGMTDQAIGGLIAKLEEYKKSARNLDPKQIKNLNNALKSLYKQQREGNPFKFMSNLMDEARSRMESYNEAIQKTQAEFTNLNIKKATQGGLNKEEEEQLQKLKKRWVELTNNQKKAGKINFTDVIEGLQQCFQWASQCVEMFTQMGDALWGKQWSEGKEILQDTMNTIQEGLQGAALGAQIGGWQGAIAGGAAGLIMGAISSFWDNADKRITEQVEESEHAVKRLENAYKNLEVAIEHAYGVAKYGAEQAAIANQKLQLVELKRQLYLERSREEKNRDEDKILDLRGQIIDLENEIKQGIEDITNDLLGITNVGSAAEELVNSMIEAFKKGEDYMQAYEDSFEKMVDNIIMKAIVSRVVGDKIQEMWDMVDQTVKERGEPYTQKMDAISEKMAENDRLIDELETQQQHGWAPVLYKEQLKKAYAYRDQLEAMMKQIQEDYNKAITPTPADVDVVRNLGQEWREGVKEEFEAWMKAFGIGYGEDSDKQLSSLQQGLQAMSESTAEGLTAYMNGVSQQCYLQSDLLTQIRDAVVGFDVDVQVATMSQMLLQLQQSYAVQLALQEILTGVLNPSGRAFMVELNS